MTPNLVDITFELLKFQEVFEEQEGEFSDEQINDYEIKQNQLEVKANNYRWFIKTLESQANLLKEEAARLASMIIAREKQVDFLKQRLKFAIESLGQINPKTGTKFLQFDTWKMWIQNNSQATVEILDENFNDPLFTTYKFSDNFNEMEMIKVKELMEQEGHKTIAIPQWDKKAIATAVLGGQKIEGVKVTKGTHVRVQ